MIVPRIYILYKQAFFFMQALSPGVIHGQLSTSLIDRSPLNPDQILADFQQLHETKTLTFQPPHLHYYKIQRMDLLSSDFKISFRENTQKREIEDIELLLHILDARIQSGLEQSIH